MNLTIKNIKINPRFSSVKWLKLGLGKLALLFPILSINAQTPELFMEGTVSTAHKERDMTIAKDENTLLYSMHTYNDDQRMIVEMKKVKNVWTDPVVVSFSGTYKDIEPMFSPDNKRLYFASDRPLFEGDESKDYNIWYVENLKNGWGDPVPMDTVINTPGDEFYPSVTATGTLYFTATKEDSKGKEDIYFSKLLEDKKYAKPVSMDSTVNSATYEFNSFVSPEEDYIIFSSYKRADGLGGGDLYISFNVDGQWQPAKHFENSINSSKLDYCPFVSADGKYLYFTSSRKIFTEVNNVDQLRTVLNKPQNGFDDIYRIPFDSIKRAMRE